MGGGAKERNAKLLLATKHKGPSGPHFVTNFLILPRALSWLSCPLNDLYMSLSLPWAMVGKRKNKGKNIIGKDHVNLWLAKQDMKGKEGEKEREGNFPNVDRTEKVILCYTDNLRTGWALQTALFLLHHDQRNLPCLLPPSPMGLP